MLNVSWSRTDIENALDLHISSESVRCKAVVIDTRDKNIKGSLFIALKGRNFDGSDFALEALRLGAGLCIVSASRDDIPNDARIIRVPDTYEALIKLAKYNRARFRGCIIGVTGSSGKTSIKEMLKLSLSKLSSRVYVTRGNFNNHIGLPLEVCNMSDGLCVLEMGINHSGELDFLSSIARPHVSIISNIGGAHMANFASVEDLVRAKCEILNHTSEAAIYYSGIDNISILEESLERQGIEGLSFGDGERDSLKLDKIHDDRGVSVCQLKYDAGGFLKYRLAEAGKHIVYNSMAVILTLDAIFKYKLAECFLDQSHDRMKAVSALESFRCIKGRGETIYGEKVTIIDESYNANPNSMIAAIQRLGEIKAKIDKRQSANKVIAVLGGMAEAGEDAYATVWSYLAKQGDIDVFYFIGADWLLYLKENGINFENISTEDVQKSIEGRKSGVNATKSPGASCCYYFSSAEDLCRNTRLLFEIGDLVLIKGSRMYKMEEIIAPLLSL